MYLLQLYQGSSQRKWKPKGAGGQQGLVSLQHHFWDAHRAAPNGRTTARSALTAQQDLTFGFCSKPALLPLDISPRKINLERLHHGASPAPEASSSPRSFPSRVLQKRLLEALSHLKIKRAQPGLPYIYTSALSK